MKRNKLIQVITAICFVFLLCGLSFVLAFSSSTNVNESSLSKTPSFTLYLVSTAKSQLESEATVLGKDAMNNDGGGYVWKNGNYYYVISSAYENENDARLVSNTLKNENIENEIFEISFETLNLTPPLDNAEAKSTFNVALNLFYSTYKELFDISISLHTNIYDETKAFIEINKVLAKADEVMKNFHLIFGKISQPLIDILEKALIDENETLGLLSENQKITEKQTLLSQIRYSYTKICAIYHNFLENIN